MLSAPGAPGTEQLWGGRNAARRLTLTGTTYGARPRETIMNINARRLLRTLVLLLLAASTTACCFHGFYGWHGHSYVPRVPIRHCR